MRLLRIGLLLTLGLAVSFCGEDQSITDSGPPSITLRYDHFTTAAAVRDELESGNAVTTAIRFRNGAFVFQSTHAPREAAGNGSSPQYASTMDEPDCTSGSVEDPEWDGRTVCREYTEAQAQKEAMEGDGFTCSDITFNEELSQWQVYFVDEREDT